MNFSFTTTSLIQRSKRFSFIVLLLCLLVSIGVADEWYDFAKRSILRGAGRPFPAHELFNLQRSVFHLPPMPEPIPNSTLLPKSTEWSYISIYSQQENLQQVLQIAIQHQQQKVSKMEHRALHALLLVTNGLAARDTNSFFQAKLILLSLPNPPKSGSFARSDIGGVWGDLLESSYTLSYASIVYDIIRPFCTVDEQKKIAQLLFQLCFRIQNGVEFIGPNNHALVSGSNVAQSILLLHKDDWEGFEPNRQSLWQLSERMMQIGLSQVGKDGVYREGPGYAQEVLFSITRLAYILKLRTNFNLFRTPILSKLVTTTSQLTDDEGTPLPFDDTFPVGGNLWQSLSSFFPYNHLIQKFATTPIRSVIRPEGLFFIVRFPRSNPVVDYEPPTQEIYLQDGYAIWREPQQWVVAMSGEPKGVWTGRHEQLDIGNVCIAIGNETILSSGGYGKQGVYDDARRYWLSGEAHSAFLVDNQPLLEWVGTPTDENQLQWIATKWNDDGMFAKLKWKQNGVELSRTFLRVGKRLILIDETDEEKIVQNQFLCDGVFSSMDVGEWKITTPSNQQLLMQTLPKSEGIELKGLVTPYAGGEKIVTRLRMPIHKKRIVLITSNHSIPAIYSETTTSDQVKKSQLSWVEDDGTNWIVTIDIDSKILIQSLSAKNEQLRYINIESTFYLVWNDELGTANFPRPMVTIDSCSFLTHKWGSVPQENHSNRSEYDSLGNYHWFVHGNPKLRIREIQKNSETPILNRLTTSTSMDQFSNWYQSQPRETRTQMERDGLDSILSYSKSALDTLGFHSTIKTVTALIDATTDGFAPNVFRIPFDFIEQKELPDSSVVTIQSRGRWESGLHLENIQLKNEKFNYGWEIKRSNPHPRLEYYQADFWNPSFTFSADHSDRFLSGFNSRLNSSNGLLFFRTELKERQWMQYKSYGSFENHSYSLLQTEEINNISYHTNFPISSLHFFTGGSYSQHQIEHNDFSQIYLQLSLPSKFYSSVQFQKQQDTRFSSNHHFFGKSFQYQILSTNDPFLRMFHFGKFLVPSVWGEFAYSNVRFYQKYHDELQLKHIRYPLISQKKYQCFTGIRKENNSFFTMDITQKTSFGYASIETGINPKEIIGTIDVGIFREQSSIGFFIESSEEYRSVRTSHSYRPSSTSQEFLIEMTWYDPTSYLRAFEKKWNIRCELLSLSNDSFVTQSLEYTQLQTGEIVAQGGFTFHW